MTESNPTNNNDNQPEQAMTAEHMDTMLTERTSIVTELQASYDQRENRRVDVSEIMQRLAEGLTAAKQAGERNLELVDRKHAVERQIALAEQQAELQTYVEELGRMAVVLIGPAEE